MALTPYTGDTDYVASLDDLPNDVGGLTAAQLKAVFDKFGTEFKAWFNNTHLSEIPGIINTGNKNILHNWDFRKPVNQRGLASYSAGYTIDRWFCGGDGTIAVDSVNRLVSITGVNAYIRQPIEFYNVLFGKVVTLSVEIGGVIYSGTGTMPSAAVVTDTVVMTILFPNGYARVTYHYSAGLMVVYIVSTTAGTISATRVKLEIGTVSTLANDAPADFGEQATLCQRFFQVVNRSGNTYSYPCFVIADSTTTGIGILPLTVPMRGIPALTVNGAWSLFISSDKTITSLVAAPAGAIDIDRTIPLIITSTGLTVGATYLLRTPASAGKIMLSADL